MSFTTRINWKEQLPVLKEKGLAGQSMVQLAEHYGVSRQRIKQIVDRYIPDWNNNYGHAVKRQEEVKQHFRKWGLKDDSDLYRIQRHKFRNKKANALHIGWTWTIEFGELLWPTHCPILGIEIDYFAESRQENSPSFDQIDAGKGYVSGNVQIISWRANRIKNDGTAEEHRRIADFLDKLTSKGIVCQENVVV